MMKQLLIGTKNQGKYKEIKSILAELPIKLISLRDVKNVPEIKETGKTYRANALKKAHTLLKAIGLPVLAEDSGLEVKALGNRPGIYSARYANEKANPELNNQKLIKELAGIPLSKRTALYKCVAVLMTHDGKTYITEGICKGKIALEPSGKKGFGYDPLFIPDGYKKTFGKLSQRIKNSISHRARAIRKLIPVIKSSLIDS